MTLNLPENNIETHRFLDRVFHILYVLQNTSDFRFLLFTVTSTNGFYIPPLSKSNLKLVCDVNIVYGNIKSENSQYDAHKNLNEIVRS